MRLPAEFFVTDDYQSTGMWAWGYSEEWESEGAGGVVLCHCFGEVHNNILFWGKRCPMSAGPIQAMLMDSLQCFAIPLCCFVKSYCIRIADRASAG
jgi:hypothetical protein